MSLFKNALKIMVSEGYELNDFYKIILILPDSPPNSTDSTGRGLRFSHPITEVLWINDPELCQSWVAFQQKSVDFWDTEFTLYTEQINNLILNPEKCLGCQQIANRICVECGIRLCKSCTGSDKMHTDHATKDHILCRECLSADFFGKYRKSSDVYGYLEGFLNNSGNRHAENYRCYETPCYQETKCRRFISET